MGKKLESKELGAVAIVPSPVTGKHWDAYNLALNAHRQHGRLSQNYHAALAIIESGSYEHDGGASNIDDEAPIRVLVWLGNEVAEYLSEEITLPPNS